ncbi:LysR family transcriptional regulator [Saccharobesus litoralis]|uniref:LysR family transcriptional regulator n=1 Tax=Saccharobesus litoralis TaxID=2172099 RepID=A0A2S0VPU4_9ALTE|nr:LysR family transcriptional regulator [Saccharobesus litoralis]AWB66213.1 LysR family transcriptional regulator [Saccharobesus litoralis]
MLDDLALFIKVVENGSLAGASKKLGLPPATVTRRIQKLEQKLDCQLINRSARQFHLTNEGERYYSECASLVSELEDRAANLDSILHETTGRLKVLAPTNMAVGMMRDIWPSFSSKYPEIQLEVNVNNTVLNFSETQADLAIRIGPQSDSGLFQKRLGVVKTILVASPEYLALSARLETPEDLQQHQLITVDTIPSWILYQDNKKFISRFPIVGKTKVNDIRLAAQLCSRSIGIALLPCSEVVDELNNGDLIQVLPEWVGEAREIYAIWSSGRMLHKRARLMLDVLIDFVKNEPVLQGEIPIKSE